MLFTGVAMQVVIIFYWIGTILAIVLFVVIPCVIYRQIQMEKAAMMESSVEIE
jgi:hypothetical protein